MLSPVTVKIVDFQAITLSSLANIYRGFGGNYSPHLQSRIWKNIPSSDMRQISLNFKSQRSMIFKRSTLRLRINTKRVGQNSP